MEVRNNYKECLTNLACSIRKYFELDYKHNTLSYIDEILDKDNPSNVILILIDGMGSNILKHTLSEDSFFLRNKLKDITTVFPATTTAATTSIRTGLNPVEHGWLGWNTYLSNIDKTITLFLKTEKGKSNTCEEFVNNNTLVKKTIVKEINEKGEYKGYELFPFGSNAYSDINDMFDKIYNLTKENGKKYIYVYDDELDGVLHELGFEHETTKRKILERNKKVEELCEKLTDSLVIVVADHGHIKIKNEFLNDYPELLNMLERTTSLEPRAVSFKVKKEFMSDFAIKFSELFGNDFNLHTKEDIINSKLFGDGIENEIFQDAIGDFIAIAKTDKCLLSDGDMELVSQHAGYTDDEIYIPLILKRKK